MKQIVSILTTLVGVFLGLLSNAVYDKYKDEHHLSDTVIFANGNIYVVSIAFAVLVVLLCIFTYFTSNAEEEDLKTAREEVRHRFEDVRSLVNRVALVPPVGFLAGLEEYSKAYFSIAPGNRKWDRENKNNNLNVIRDRLLIIATLANDYFEEHNSTFFVATLMLSIEVKSLTKAKIDEYENIIKFKGAGVSLGGLDKILLYESELAVSTTKAQTLAKDDFCLPVFANDGPQLPGAPSVLVNDCVQLYCSAEEISAAAQNSGLAASVVSEIKQYFEGLSEEIQSLICIPLHSPRLHGEQNSSPVGVLSLHTNRATEHSDQRISLFVAHLQPFLAVLSKEVDDYRKSIAILGTNRRKNERS